ncbi:MAG TPA: peptidase T [Chitinophagales bacterium]|nr:peptidase T [Chitinophagales bacterium]
MNSLNITHTVTERFLRYVKIDTQSDPESSAVPSTEKQKDLSRILVEELKAMGITDAHLDEFGIVYATIPSNTYKNVPAICFCSHVDTSPDCSGANVNPVLHEKYDGKDLVLPNDASVMIRMSEHEDLKDQIGNDIITSDGTTLLGADNKSGVAAIMDAANHLMTHPEIMHGTIKILFTPDEEVGHGVDHVDMKKLDAQFGYTIDGETAGTLEDETWSADLVVITITGVSVHPGFAKGKMENAIKIAAGIIDELPADELSPETTEGRDGFIHPVSLNASLEQATIKLIIRDFTVGGLHDKEKFLQAIVTKEMNKYAHSTFKFEVIEQYRNMKEVLDKFPHVSAYAMEAMHRAGLQPKTMSIRGGTDGSRLSFMGMPCPNIFAGEHAFHSKQEWVSVQDMQKAVETIVHLCMIWEEKS